MKQIKEVRFYLEVDLYEKIVKLAEKDNRDFSNMVETVLKRWVEREENMWEFRANYPLTPDDSYPSRPPSDGKPFNPFVYPYTDIRTDGPIIYHTPPGTVPDGRILTDPPITVCEGTTVGPNGAMFASTDNPNGTCVTNGEEVGDRGVEVVMNNWKTDGSYEVRHLGKTIRVPFGSEMDKHLHAIAAREQKEDKESFLADQREDKKQ